MSAEVDDTEFGEALAEFLNEHAGTAAEVYWRVDYDGQHEWEVRLWLDDEFQGRFRVTPTGSALIEAP